MEEELLDIEMNESELKELCEHYDVEYPEVVKSDSHFCQVLVNENLKYVLDLDNIAYWKAGEIF